MIRKFRALFTPNQKNSSQNAEVGSDVKTVPEEPKSSLAQYLNYYVSTDKPGFALLVTGEWGSGKTYQVKSLLKERDRVYVSLFGVASVEQLHSEVFAAAFPKRAGLQELLAQGGDAAEKAGGLFSLASIVPSVVASRLRQSFDVGKILVFDDLERSALHQSDLLGAINYYVEQLGARVVVLAHDERLAASFREVKEKIFGHTVRVEPEFESAFRKFVDEVESVEAKKTLELYGSVIAHLFGQSGIGSLRVLRLGLHAVARLISTIDPEIRSNKRVLEAALQQFFVFSIEVSAGRLSAEDLFGRRNARMAHLMRNAGNREERMPAPPIVAALDRYPEADLDDELFDDQVLVKAVIGGVLSGSEINAMLRRSRFLASPDRVESWKIALMFDELGAEVAEVGFKGMLQELAGRKIVLSGEILHAASIMMMLSCKGAYEKSVDQIVEFFKIYIDELLADGVLEPSGTKPFWVRDFDGSFGGVAYWVEDTYSDKFRLILDYLIAAREAAFRGKFPDIALQLLDFVENDPQKFFELVSPTNNGDNPYAKVEILQEIDPAEFVRRWALGHPFSARYVKFALENRYAAGELNGVLSSEREWLQRVRDEIELRATSCDGFEKVRILRFLPNLLREF